MGYSDNAIPSAIIQARHQQPDSISIGGNPIDKQKAINLAVGALGAGIGYKATDYYISDRLIEFDQIIDNKTAADIRKHAGSGFSEARFGEGGGSSSLRRSHTLNLIKSGNHPLPSFLYKVGGGSYLGGRSVVALGTALLAGVSAYALTSVVNPSKPAISHSTLMESSLKAQQQIEPHLQNQAIPTVREIDQEDARHLLDLIEKLKAEKAEPSAGRG